MFGISGNTCPLVRQGEFIYGKYGRTKSSLGDTMRVYWRSVGVRQEQPQLQKEWD